MDLPVSVSVLNIFEPDQDTADLDELVPDVLV